MNYPTRKPKPVPEVSELNDAENARLVELQDKSYFWHLNTFTDADQKELDALNAKANAASDYQGYLSRLRMWNQAHPNG